MGDGSAQSILLACHYHISFAMSCYFLGNNLADNFSVLFRFLKHVAFDRLYWLMTHK
jgi:hypothetical protein